MPAPPAPACATSTGPSTFPAPFGFDGGTLKLSLDGGAYEQVPASALSGVSYNGSLYHACLGAGPAGTPIFTGTQSAFQETEVDLDAACGAITGGTGGCTGALASSLK